MTENLKTENGVVYELVQHAAWVEYKGVAVRICATPDGLNISAWGKNRTQTVINKTVPYCDEKLEILK